MTTIQDIRNWGVTPVAVVGAAGSLTLTEARQQGLVPVALVNSGTNLEIATYLATATLPAGIITTSQPMTLTQTWNAGGVTFTALVVNPSSTASSSASMIADFQLGGVSAVSIRKDGTIIGTADYRTAGGSFWVNSDDPAYGFRIGTALDIALVRDAANTLALRNATNAQAFNVYNSWTDAANNEYVSTGFTSNRAHLGTDKNGSGTQRSLDLWGSDISLKVGAGGGSSILTVTTTAVTSNVALVFGTDNSFDIGATGATRPRDYFGAGKITLGGTPIVEAATAIPAGGSAGKGYRFSSTSNFGVFFGSGVPTLAAAQGSLYIRSDGSSTSTRAYINTNGSTTWTAITTAA